MRLWHVPVRLATGAYILESGIKKWSSDDNEEMQKHVHSMAASAYPQFASMDHRTFTKALAAGEITLGSALLLPVVPAGWAGAGLAAFSGGLIGLYMRLPGMRQSGSIRPSSDGTALAKDSWLLAIAGALIVDAVTTRAGRAAASARAKLPGGG
ncbi:MAG TPA: hypothetical protein VKI19_00700 [Acidimicrobiales bacterium]|nr:hypothetical protein [Acidimicrobiales bacterium]